MVNNEPKVFIRSDEEMDKNEFDSGSEDELDIICNMISMLPFEYDTISEVAEKEDGLAKEMVIHKPLCYYVMHDGPVNEDKNIFRSPEMSMQQHLKPLYIRSKV